MVALHEVGRADRALESLDKAGLAAYRPLFRRRRISRGKVVWDTRPLLDRYFFIHYDTDWQAAYGEDLVGLDRIITRKDVAEPYLVADEVVEALRASEVRGFVPITPHRFKVGQRVQVNGFTGCYDGLSKDQGFEEFLLYMLGRTQRVRLEYGLAEAA